VKEWSGSVSSGFLLNRGRKKNARVSFGVVGEKMLVSSAA